MQFLNRSFPGTTPRSFPLPGRFLAKDGGSALIEFALMLPLLVVLLTGAVDLGRAWYFDIEVASAAEAGALYGLRNPADIPGMNAAAALDAPDLTGLQTSSTYGNECSDGSSVVPLSASSPTCSSNAVEYVEVDTTVTYKPILIYPGASSLFTLSAKSRLRTMN